MHVVAWFPGLSYPQLARLIELGAARGLGLHPVHPYYHAPPAHPGLLVGFAGLSSTQINTATQLLGQCLQELHEST
jgi:GntR family transcriptional regulator / MocR family aminotransferase